MILVGTSGWQYRDWKDRFYPAGLPQREWLPFFSERFPTVEVNNSFYRLPTEDVFVRWREASAPRFGVDVELLRAFLGVLPSPMRAAFEFRDPSWDRPEVLEALDRAGAASVLANRPGWRVPHTVTGGWSYIRFHQGTPSAPGYTRDKLRRWTERIAGLEASDVYVYFNNDTGGAAVRDAATLIDLLEGAGLDVVRPPAES